MFENGSLSKWTEPISKSINEKTIIKNFYHLITIVAFLVTLWLIAPSYLRKAIIYSYVDIDGYHLFHNRIIKTALPYPWALSDNYNNKQLESKYLDTLNLYQSTAFLIIQNDSIFFKKYFKETTDTTLSNSFSMAKSVVSLLIGAAIRDGYIKNIDQPVRDFIPNLINHTTTELTIKHLLTMSSGSNWNESYSSP